MSVQNLLDPHLSKLGHAWISGHTMLKTSIAAMYIRSIHNSSACATNDMLLSLAHGDLATNDFVSWPAAYHSRSRKLLSTLWALQVSLCHVIHNSLYEALDQGPLATL